MRSDVAGRNALFLAAGWRLGTAAGGSRSEPDAGKKAQTPREAGRHTRPLPSPEEIAMLAPDGGPRFNRLIHEKSPYLLQHARNPVAWYPWGPEAVKAARERDVPIFLSVGYSTCHWCHVMAHESFEDPEVARLLNQNFVAVKVDREERPDIDAIYLSATQLLTGHGGWPNSVWLTPDGRPFFAGAYFPPEDHHGRPGFKTMLRRLARGWKSRRGDVEKQAHQIAAALRQMATGRHVTGRGQPGRQLVNPAIAALRRAFDSKHGGFGSRPRFPPHGALALLLYEYERTKDRSLLAMATHTLDAMRLGGIHDHVGGGFARYATDDAWLLPHFEKMLYDNAQLARAYTDAWRVTRNAAYRRTAERTLDWVLREMTSPGGAFTSAYDADSEGQEGKFYLWRKAEVIEILGEQEGELFCRAYHVTDEGNFHEEATGRRPGTNILHLTSPLEAIAAGEKLDPDAFRGRMEAALNTLYDVRKSRVWPHLDDKVVASWNGLMIGALAHAGHVLDRPDYVEAAARAAGFVLAHLRTDQGRLLRTWRAGGARLNAYLDDYAFLAHGLLELHEATGEKQWLTEAEALVAAIREHFADTEEGGFFFTSDDHERLLTRTKEPFDTAIPSGNGMTARVLVRLARRTGNHDYLSTAARSFAAFLGLLERVPRASESLLLALARYYDAFTPAERGEKPASGGPAADAAAVRGPVQLELFLARTQAAPGDTLPLALRITVDKGWHVNAHEPRRPHLTPTRVTLAKNEAATLGEVNWPRGKAFTPAEGDGFHGYDGTVLVKVPVVLAAEVKARPVKLTLEVAFQACGDRRCLAPQTVVLAVTLAVVPGAKPGRLRHRQVFEKLGGD